MSDAPVEQASETQTFTPAEAAHPSSYILEELFERDWSLGELAWRMLPDPSADNDANRRAVGVNMLALQMYILCWTDERSMRLGDELATGLARAFGTSAELFLNIERSYVAAQPELRSKDQRIAELERTGGVLIDECERLRSERDSALARVKELEGK